MPSILFLTAEPRDASRLRLGEEMRAVHEQLQRSRLRDQFQLHLRPCARPVDLTQALLDLRPDIVHFSGHGEPNSLALEDDLGMAHALSGASLAQLFERFRGTTKCVILNACYSVDEAKQLAEHIDFVVGMRGETSDSASIAFAVGFYQAAGAGRPFDEAFEFGCIQIRLRGLAEESTPLLFRKCAAAPSAARVSTPNFWPGFEGLKDELHSTALSSRLQRDEEGMRKLADESSSLEVLDIVGAPAIRYILQYRLKGIVGITVGGDPLYASSHLVEMVIPTGYPMQMPYVQFYTPIFHPNIYDLGQVCLGWFGIPYQLPEVAVHVGRMIDYQVYNTQSASNRAASNWAVGHANTFPLQNWDPVVNGA